jgi:hypothetical protein
MAFTTKPVAAAPAARIDPQTWVERAPVGASRTAEAPATPSRPWEQLDPKAPASKAFNLRLNDYELELLRAISDAEFCSQQALAKKILVRALEQAAAALK